MLHFRTLLVVLTLLFVSTGIASAALMVSATQNQPAGYNVGDLIVIDITIETTGPEAVALGLRAGNYDPSVASNATPTLVPSVIFDFMGSGFGGLNNSGTPGEQAPGGPRPGWSVNLFQGVSLVPAASSGPAHFQVTFIKSAPGITTIDIGALAEYGDAYGGGDNIAFNTSLVILDVPEPGTALLMALGLAGLGATRRRR